MSKFPTIQRLQHGSFFLFFYFLYFLEFLKESQSEYGAAKPFSRSNFCRALSKASGNFIFARFSLTKSEKYSCGVFSFFILSKWSKSNNFLFFFKHDDGQPIQTRTHPINLIRTFQIIFLKPKIIISINRLF